jgi:hypothetical protein
MKALKICLIFSCFLLTQIIFSQQIDPFLHNYSIYKSYHSEKAKEYSDVDGSPYLNSEFVEGVIYMLDTVIIKLPLRYNIYTDEMEYKVKGTNYVVANPQNLNKITIGQSIFLYKKDPKNTGYFELFESGKCTLLQKKVIIFKPAEGPKPIAGVAVSAEFVRKSDIFYFVVNHSPAVRIENIKSVLKALEDQQSKIESFIKENKIGNIRNENIVKIVKYYNTL